MIIALMEVLQTIVAVRSVPQQSAFQEYRLAPDDPLGAIWFVGVILIWGLFPLLGVIAFIFKELRTLARWGAWAVFTSLISGMLVLIAFYIGFANISD
jgi:hypothetical protein